MDKNKSASSYKIFFQLIATMLQIAQAKYVLHCIKVPHLNDKLSTSLYTELGCTYYVN